LIRHLRSNLIAYFALFLALSGGSFAVAALNGHDKRVIKKIVNKQITRRAPGLSVSHANTANEATHAGSADTATSANSALSAQSADTAGSVGGVSIEPVRIALPDGAPSTPVVSVDGTSVDVEQCGTGVVSLGINRGVSGPPVVAAFVRSNASQHAIAFLQAPGGSSLGDSAAGLNASIRESSGHVTRVLIDYFYEQNAYGGTDDCFVQGTIERFG
jgi:hypothetical protein